jgi:formylglycine-generating enzyme required for sulfatase activity
MCILVLDGKNGTFFPKRWIIDLRIKTRLFLRLLSFIPGLIAPGTQLASAQSPNPAPQIELPNETPKQVPGEIADLAAREQMTVNRDVGVRLSWKPTNLADSYEVWRSSSPDVQDATLVVEDWTSVTYLDAPLPPQIEMYYWVRPVNQHGSGPFSGGIRFEIAAQNIKPPIPLSVSWSSIDYPDFRSEITMTWLDPGNSEIIEIWGAESPDRLKMQMLWGGPSEKGFATFSNPKNSASAFYYRLQAVTKSGKSATSEAMKLELPQWPTKTGRPSIIPGLNLQMVWVPSGKITLGVKRLFGDLDEKNETLVVIPEGLWMGSTEVTISQYLHFINNVPNTDQMLPKSNRPFIRRENNPDYQISPNYSSDLPITGITWIQARAFCNWLTKTESEYGRLPEGFQFRLPTESEWLLAANELDRIEMGFPYESELSGQDTVQIYSAIKETLFQNYSWFDSNTSGFIKPVAQKGPILLGIYDQVGNASEWLEDWYSEFPGGAIQNWMGPETGREKTFIGGSFTTPPLLLSTRKRNALRPEWSSREIGFRLVLSSHNPDL